jgi:hypothetical protein
MTTLATNPLFERLRGSRRVLLAGAGGGFDVYAAIPLYLSLQARGVEVHLANLTFTDLAQALRGGGPIAVVTGAGVSLASGIPTFRGPDPGAVWTQDVTALGTHRYFREDPAGSWRWYLARFDGLADKVPNDAHLALAALERWQVGRGEAFTARGVRWVRRPAEEALPEVIAALDRA